MLNENDVRYAVAVIAKQSHLSPAEATAQAERLSAGDISSIVLAGRAGDLAGVQSLLKNAKPEPPAEKPKAKK